MASLALSTLLITTFPLPFSPGKDALLANNLISESDNSLPLDAAKALFTVASIIESNITGGRSSVASRSTDLDISLAVSDLGEIGSSVFLYGLTSGSSFLIRSTFNLVFSTTSDMYNNGLVMLTFFPSLSRYIFSKIFFTSALSSFPSFILSLILAVHLLLESKLISVNLYLPDLYVPSPADIL